MPLGLACRLRRRPRQVSPGKNADYPHTLATSTPSALGNLGFRYVVLAHPAVSASCGSCSSSRGSRLRLPPDPVLRRRPCPWLTVRIASTVEDSHLQVSAHAGRTRSGAAMRGCPLSYGQAETACVGDESLTLRGGWAILNLSWVETPIQQQREGLLLHHTIITDRIERACKIR